MTTLDTTRSAAPAVAFGTMFTTFFGTMRTWNDARVTRKSLNKLSARELDDIGLCRGDIDAIATRGGRF